MPITELSKQNNYEKTKLNETKPLITILESATMPITAAAPNKIMIIFLFAFLGGFACAVKIASPKFTEE